MSRGVAITARKLVRTYEVGESKVEVLRSLDLDLSPGEVVAVVGPSGSGKSTLMHLLGLLDRPTQGSLKLDGVESAGLSDRERDRLRNGRIGFVFQAHNLLPEHTALGNVMMPVRLAGGGSRVAQARATALLEAVGLGHRLDHRPGQLSGGEQQRVAIARALVMAPGLILADEPTGNLDPDTAQRVFDLLMQLNQQLGSTLVVVTHSLELAATLPRRLLMHRGRIEEDRAE